MSKPLIGAAVANCINNSRLFNALEVQVATEDIEHQRKVSPEYKTELLISSSIGDSAWIDAVLLERLTKMKFD